MARPLGDCAARCRALFACARRASYATGRAMAWTDCSASPDRRQAGRVCAAPFTRPNEHRGSRAAPRQPRCAPSIPRRQPSCAGRGLSERSRDHDAMLWLHRFALCVLALIAPLALADTTHDDALWQLVRLTWPSLRLTSTGLALLAALHPLVHGTLLAGRRDVEMHGEARAHPVPLPGRPPPRGDPYVSRLS